MKRISVLMATLAFSATATGQVVGLGTTQVGATFQLSTGVAKVVSDKGGVQMRTQPMAGAAQYAPLVNRGDIDFGISNIVELYYLQEGKVIVEGREHKDLRMVARLVPWYNGLVVKADSPMRTVKDLKGQPVPAGFTGNPLGKVLISGYLANAGMSFEDTRQVPVPSFPRMFDAFKQQQTATSIATIGMAQLKEWESTLGGVRFLSFDPSPQAVQALTRYIRGSYVVEVQPGPGRTGVASPTHMVVYDYTLWANAKVADDVVGKVVQALYDNPGDLKAASPLWAEFEPAQMAKDLGIEYHPGAIKAYRAKGVWKR
ncbi:MAG TPA: TAXI family TRAP transporter solute-binding subunit [Burkholderiales bacterium]|nr:TAXI family TRAP transporter solute-binding subunit [Burkholderiales bacterium]